MCKMKANFVSIEIIPVFESLYLNLTYCQWRKNGFDILSFLNPSNVLTRNSLEIGFIPLNIIWFGFKFVRTIWAVNATDLWIRISWAFIEMNVEK